MILLLVPASAISQTYDTLPTLVVALDGPLYLSADQDGHAVVYGMVRNDSTNSYVGNVQVVAKFYDSYNQVVISNGTTHLEVIPPGASSPFTIRTISPQPGITMVTASLLFFESANPKSQGLTIHTHDVSPLGITLRDTAGTPHTNPHVYVIYHDHFEPPRILEIHTFAIHDIPQYGHANVTVANPPPAGAGGYMIFAQSDVFSAGAAGGPLPPSTYDISPGAFINDTWVSDMDGVRTNVVSANHTVTIHASIHTDDDADYTLYVQVTRIGEAAPSLLSAHTTTGNSTVVVEWTPEPGRYYAELFLWGDIGTATPQQGPLVLFRVE